MEIRMPPKVGNYKESIFMGLSYRQFLCSALCIGSAAGIYFLTHDILGREIASWICLISGAPFAMMGFFRYNKLPAERILIAILLTILRRKRRVYRAQNRLQEVQIQEDDGFETVFKGK